MSRNPTTGVYSRVVNSFSEPVTGEVIDPTDAGSFWDDLTDALNDLPGELSTFVQSGTGAATRTMQDKAREIFSATDFTGVDPTGATDSTAGIVAAIAAVPYGATIFFPRGFYSVKSASSPIFSLNDKSITIEGDGWGTVFQIHSSVGSGIDLFSSTISASTEVRGVKFRNFLISNNSATNGRSWFVFDSSASGATIAAIEIIGVLAPEGAGRFASISGGTAGTAFDITIAQNTIFGGGILLSSSGDSIRVQNNIITGTNPALDVNQAAGAGGLLVTGNNITTSAGQLLIRRAIKPTIIGNEFEQTATCTEANNAMIDLLGDVGLVESPLIHGNTIASLTGFGNPNPIRIANADTPVVDANRVYVSSSYNHVVITSAAANAILTAENAWLTGSGVAGNLVLSNASASTAITPKYTATPTQFGILYGAGGTGTTTTAAMTDGQLLVGQTSAAALPKTLSGDATLAASGAITLASTISAGGPTGSATVAPIITYDAKGRLTAVSSATITPAVGSITGLGTGIATALAVNVGTAGSPVINGGALGSPSSAGTLPAHTLGGTVSGGGNQINNVIIGASTPLAGSFTTLSASTSATITSASATSLTVGLNGATNPAFTVDSSTGSQAAGLKVTGAATGGTVAVVATDSGSNTNLTINAKGSGTIGIGSVSTGAVTITPNVTHSGTTTLSGALTYGGVTLTNNVTGTGKMVLDAGPTITGHATIEGVTATGATGTGKFVFDASPTLTGTPLTPTAALGTNTTQVASTAFVQAARVQVISANSGVDGTQIAAGVTRYVGNGAANATESFVALVWSRGGTVKNLYIYSQGAAGVGQSYTVTYRQSLTTDSALTAQISGGSGNSASDTTHTVTVAAGERWSIKFVSTGGAAATTLLYAFEFVPDPG